VRAFAWDVHSALERLESLHRKSQTLSVAALTDFKPGLRLIIREAGLEVKDQCQCRCSPDGCSSLHLLLNYTLSYLHLRISEESYGCADCEFRLKTFPEQEGILEKCVGDYSRSIYYRINWRIRPFWVTTPLGLQDHVFFPIISVFG
jgi:hypothetical protein